jgi:hypothetical protein
MYIGIFIFLYLSIISESVQINNCKKLWDMNNEANGITIYKMGIYACIEDININTISVPLLSNDQLYVPNITINNISSGKIYNIENSTIIHNIENSTIIHNMTNNTYNHIIDTILNNVNISINNFTNNTKHTDLLYQISNSTQIPYKQNLTIHQSENNLFIVLIASGVFVFILIVFFIGLYCNKKSKEKTKNNDKKSKEKTKNNDKKSNITNKNNDHTIVDIEKETNKNPLYKKKMRSLKFYSAVRRFSGSKKNSIRPQLNEQNNIAKRQNDIAKRQNDIAKRQNKFGKKQNDIAKRQDKFGKKRPPKLQIETSVPIHSKSIIKNDIKNYTINGESIHNYTMEETDLPITKEDLKPSINHSIHPDIKNISHSLMENARKQPYNMKIKEISNSPRRRIPTPPSRAPPPPLPSIAKEQLNQTMININSKYYQPKSQ